jgi:hypothetical protein
MRRRATLRAGRIGVVVVGNMRPLGPLQDWSVLADASQDRVTIMRVASSLLLPTLDGGDDQALDEIEDLPAMVAPLVAHGG